MNLELPRIAVIGAGPGGLFTAHLLEKYLNRPVQLEILEASSRIGGKIQTMTFANQTTRYEAGAAEFYDYSNFEDDALKTLITDLGLSTQAFAGQAVVFRGQHLQTLDDIDRVLGSTARAEIERFHQRASDSLSPLEFYLSNSEEAPPLIAPDINFAAELGQCSATDTRRYLETLIHSDLATEPNLTNVTYGLHNYLMNDPRYMSMYSIVGGNEQLPQTLAASLAAPLHLQHQVATVRVNARGGRDVLDLEIHAPQQRLVKTYDYVVIAVPHDALLKIDYAPSDLKLAATEHYRHYHHPAHYLRITLLFSQRFWLQHFSDSFCMLDCWDGCCLYDESSRETEPQLGVLGWLCGGASAVELAQRTDQELIAAALDSLPKDWPAAADFFREGRVHRWLDAVNGMPGGRQIRPMDLRHQPYRPGHSQLYWVGDYLFDSTLNGVLESADYVAEQIAIQINQQLD